MHPHFNTSHVTVYRILHSFHVVPTVISIHLMLLFILATHPITPSVVIFQYISCYCLSIRLPCNRRHSFISIHLMLLFIGAPRNCCRRYSRISIHLMLLFIEEADGALFIIILISIHLMLLFIRVATVHSE